MNRIEAFSGIAPRTGGAKIRYELWIDEKGALYAQIVENITSAKNPGTHSDRLFRLSDYLDARYTSSTAWKMVGLDPERFEEVKESGENNDAGFLKAILKHLFPKPKR